MSEQNKFGFAIVGFDCLRDQTILFFKNSLCAMNNSVQYFVITPTCFETDPETLRSEAM